MTGAFLTLDHNLSDNEHVSYPSIFKIQSSTESLKCEWPSRR